MQAPSLLQEQISREVDATLKLLDDTRNKSRRADVPGWLWLRAARGCWLIGNVDWARDFYRRSVPPNLETAQTSGRRSGNFEQYAALAMGAAWMSESEELLHETCRAVDQSAESQITSIETPPEAYIRVGLLLTRLRANWFRGQISVIKEIEPDLSKRVRALDAWTKSFWDAERGSSTHIFIKAVIDAKFEPIRQALGDLDRKLFENRTRPPTINDLVDEEFVSFATSMIDVGTPLPARVTTPVEPGMFG